MKIETTAVHAGADVDPSTGAIAPPIHLSTTFEHGPASEEIHRYSYIREKNPTQSRLEEALAQLDSGEGAVAFASGMAAGVAVVQTLPQGLMSSFQTISTSRFDVLLETSYRSGTLSPQRLTCKTLQS